MLISFSRSESSQNYINSNKDNKMGNYWHIMEMHSSEGWMHFVSYGPSHSIFTWTQLKQLCDNDTKNFKSEICSVSTKSHVPISENMST